jgi:hypothetical protein
MVSQQKRLIRHETKPSFDLILTHSTLSGYKKRYSLSLVTLAYLTRSGVRRKLIFQFILNVRKKQVDIGTTRC